MAGELNFLDVYNLLLFLSFLILFIAFEAEFAVIHHAAYGRIRNSGDKNEIKILLVCAFKRFFKGQKSDRFAFGTDDTYDFLRSKVYLFVDKMLLGIAVLYCKAPPFGVTLR